MFLNRGVFSLTGIAQCKSSIRLNIVDDKEKAGVITVMPSNSERNAKDTPRNHTYLPMPLRNDAEWKHLVKGW